MPKISVQLYSVRDAAKQDFPGTIRKIASFGYAGVEFAGLHGMTPADVRGLLDDCGLKASSAHCGITTPENLSQQVDAAKTLGYDLLIGGWKREDWDTEDGVRRAAEAWQRAAELLRPHGLKAGYHNHWWEMKTFGARCGYDLFLQGAPDVIPQIDTYWAANFGQTDVLAFVKRWAKRASTLHIKDGPLVKDQPHTAVGKGKMNVPAVVAAADAATLKWLIVELDACATDMLTAVRESCEYLVSRKLGTGR